jgi:TonB-linked SusC/RagA family outer membrane protein
MNQRLIRISLIVFIILLIFEVDIFSQVNLKDSILIRGSVLSIDNQPINDAAISIEGKAGDLVLTDSLGKFSIKTIPGHKWLAISSIGHQNKRILIEDQEYIHIYLAPLDIPSSRNSFEYFNKEEERRNAITPVSHLATNDTYRSPYNNVGDYMQGRVAGVLAINNSGMPGSGSYLMLRGLRSLHTNNHPLVIIDGMPIEPPGTLINRIEGNIHNSLNSINPLDISEIIFLKDAGSTALYGVNGSNGVILIKTLDPSAVQTTIDFSLRTGITLTPRITPQLNSPHFKNLANEILSTSNMNEDEYVLLYPGLFYVPGERGFLPYSHETNWQEEIFNSGMMQEAYLSVKGGDEISRYGLSVGYLNQEGIVTNSDFIRYNVRFTSFLNVYSWLEMNINANLNNSNSSLMPSALNTQASPILTSFFKSPMLSPYNYDDNGNLLNTISDIREFNVSNPRAVTERSNSSNANNQFISSISLRAKLNDKLSWNSMFGLGLNNLKEEIFRPRNGMAEYFDGLAYSYSERNTNRLMSMYTNHYLSYANTLGQVHNVGASAGFRVHTNNIEHDWSRASNLPVNDQFSDLQSGDNRLDQLGGILEQWNRLGSYMYINYIYKDRYLASASGSLDFTSRNGKENENLINIGNKMPLGYFYSFGAGWRVSGEGFLNNVSWLENLLFRASYGIAGNDDIGNINALDYYQQVRYRETTGLIPGTIYNPVLKHEDSKQFNAGIDLSFTGERINFSFDYFRNLTTDLFIYRTQPPYFGFTQQPYNGGELLNSGFEVYSFMRFIHSNRFSWDISGNVTKLNNKVLKINEDLNTPFPGGQFISRTGYNAASFYGYDFMGVYSTTEEAKEQNLVNARGIPFGAGDAIYRDISGPDGQPDGIIDSYDMIALGSPIPDYFGSLSNRFRYRNIVFDFTFHFVLGNEVFNYLRYQNEKMTDLSNQSVSTLRRWQKEGDITNVPRALYNDPLGNSDFSSRWIEDGSYLKLRDITLSYRMPDEFIIFKNAEFFVSGKNLFTLSNYLGYNPEFSHAYNPMEQGVDYGMMPNTRQFVLGVKMGL